MKVKKCEVVAWIEHLPGGAEHWREELEKNLADNRELITAWVYILHDKDMDKEGNPRKPHIHLLLSLQEGCQINTIADRFGVSPYWVSRIKQRIRKGNRYYVDMGGAISYLTHRNVEGLYKYDDSEVVAMPGYDWQAERAKSEEYQSRGCKTICL